MEEKPRTIVVRTSAGYLPKGLIAVPKGLRRPFPKQRGQVTVLLDDENTLQMKPYSPYESSMRQCRIGGLHARFRRHGLKGGESVVITVVDEAAGIYRLTLGQREQERQAREQLHAAQTDTEADVGLKRLAWLRQRPERDVALAELRRLAQQQREEERRRLPVSAAARRESAPANIRALLKAVHDGKCQFCEFTFRKRDGEPYFEIHHIEGEKGNQLWNLPVVCANCHMQLTHADVERFEKRGNWVVAVTINGERKEVYQPLLSQSASVLVQAAQLSCWLVAVAHLCLSHCRAWT